MDKERYIGKRVVWGYGTEVNISGYIVPHSSTWFVNGDVVSVSICGETAKLINNRGCEFWKVTKDGNKNLCNPKKSCIKEEKNKRKKKCCVN